MLDLSQLQTADDKAKVAREQAYQQWKTERAQLLASMTVEVNGYEYQANEEALNRLAREVAAADDLSEETTWTMADNEEVIVTFADLKQALKLAMDQQKAIWNDGRPVV